MRKTTNERLGLVAVLALSPSWFAVAQAQEAFDQFHWLAEMNKASLVMLVEQDIVSPELGGQIADALTQVIESAAQPGAIRSGDYLALERAMIDIGGAEVTRIHTGRSRQDMLATSNRILQRHYLLASYERMNEAREVLLSLARDYANDVMPAYTWGVQAQPFTMGHFVLGFTEALERVAQRMRQAYERTNASPLGSAALGTSSFAIDRERLAELLGFDGLVENSFGAVHVAPIDTDAELVAVAGNGALTLSAFLAYVAAQYHDPEPWIVIDEAGGGRSSIMPQKRSPVSLVSLRAAASRVLGQAQTFLILAHNVEPGAHDYKGSEPHETLESLAELFSGLAELVERMVFDKQRALAELNADYSTTTELADVLQRQAQVPFRVGHHFASELVSFGRSRGFGPTDFPYREAQRIFAAAAADYGLASLTFPLSEAEFRQSLSAENMVAASKGRGGPQPAEVARMLEAQTARLAEDRVWADTRRRSLAQASEALASAFDALESPSR